MATQFRLKLAKGNDVFEAEGDKKFVEDMYSQYSGGAKQGGSKPAPHDNVNNGNGKSLSVSEFIRRLGLKKHVDRVLAFGYYLEKYSGQDQFTVADINRCYYESKLENSNTSMMVSSNVKHGYIMVAKNDGSKKPGYTLTTSGDDFIAAKLKAAID